jgi:hypothetical protein
MLVHDTAESPSEFGLSQSPFETLFRFHQVESHLVGLVSFSLRLFRFSQVNSPSAKTGESGLGWVGLRRRGFLAYLACGAREQQERDERGSALAVAGCWLGRSCDVALSRVGLVGLVGRALWGL